MRILLAQLLHCACQPRQAPRGNALGAARRGGHLLVCAGRLQVAVQIVERQQVNVHDRRVGSVRRLYRARQVGATAQQQGSQCAGCTG